MPRLSPPRPVTVAVALAVVALAVAASAGGYLLAGGANGSTATSGTVEVTATGVVRGTPDTLTLQLAVVTKAKSATLALDQNNVDMRRVQAVFVSAGVKSANLQTSGLDVSPDYDNKGRLTGYGAEDDLTATLTDISRSGAVIDAAEHAAGNDVEINDIAFSLSKTSGLDRRARVLAMSEARAEALDFARGGGEALGSIERITQSETSTPVSPLPGFSAAAAAPSSVPVKAGTESVSVQVDVVYRLIG